MGLGFANQLEIRLALDPRVEVTDVEEKDDQLFVHLDFLLLRGSSNVDVDYRAHVLEGVFGVGKDVV